MKFPPEVELLCKQLEAEYPRAAKNIRLMWSNDKDSQSFFKDILSYSSGENKIGFSPQAFMTVSKIRDIYFESFVEFSCLNMTKDQKKRFRDTLMDVWDRAIF